MATGDAATQRFKESDDNQEGLRSEQECALGTGTAEPHAASVIRAIGESLAC